MSKELSSLERQSKWLFGSVHVIPVWAQVGRMAVGERFLTREVAHDLGIESSTVKPILNRLAAINLIQQTDPPKPSKSNPWEKLDSPTWDELVPLLEATIERFGPENDFNETNT